MLNRHETKFAKKTAEQKMSEKTGSYTRRKAKGPCAICIVYVYARTPLIYYLPHLSIDAA